ncbi:aconitate hydratase 1 [Fusarium acutatum]|uniref:Aconitate hydratase, mitochondrial n=1 Tax=Fusarium acutatum TaxID=78861 RepID=A0A8H4JXW2_9HYPO|nr:aconitate hydratase 1 [Fusarium acutatum]
MSNCQLHQTSSDNSQPRRLPVLTPVALSTPMATRINAPKKVRLACRRCRVRRIKVCLDVDSQNSDIVIPRNFVSAARERIRWLEDIVRDRLPDVDLRSGPQVDPSSDPTAPSQDERIPEDADITISSIPPVSTSSRKRSAEASGQSDQDESFPERAHSVAVNLGMLSLNIDSPQKHYLGSSSGLLFTNLIGASPPSVDSTPQGLQGDKYAGELEWSDDTVAQDQNRKYHQELYSLLKQELPSKHNALVLIHTYIRWIHPDFPFLEPLSLFSAVEAIYLCLDGILECDISSHGWPANMLPFRWNGRAVVPGVSNEEGVTFSAVAFILFMVFNIGALVKVRSRNYDFPPQRFYRAALHFSKEAFAHITLSSIQSLMMLVMHGMLTPAEVNLWTLVHLGLAYCVETGIHREQGRSSPEGFAIQQGRPLGFRDETFDIKIPEPLSDLDENAQGPLPPSFITAVTRYSSYHFRLDRIVSNIKLHLYHLPGDSSFFPWPDNPTEQQARIQQTLQNWWQEVSSDAFEYPSLDNRQREVWKIKLGLKYHTTMVLLFQPSQVIRQPASEALQACFDSAAGILDGYQRLHDLHGLHFGWRAVQNIFAAGATLIYSFWTSQAVREKASPDTMSKNLRSCSTLLTIGGEWWPSARNGQASFGSVADLTMKRLYVANASNKAPRLSLQQTASGRPRHGADIDAPGTSPQPQFSNENGQSAVVDTSSAWQNLDLDVGGNPDQFDWPSIEGGFDPEIEMFLEDFNRSDFTWSFPLNDNQDLDLFGADLNPGSVSDEKWGADYSKLPQLRDEDLQRRYNALDYTTRLESLRRVQDTNKRPLTLSEKLLYSHLIHDNDDWVLDQIERGKTILRLRPDRVACHDATATMALLQFISAGLPRVQVPTSVHSDHLIVAEYGSKKDLERAAGDHREVYAFLSSAAKKYGIGYWKPGAGIIHTTIFENYAFPGGLFIGTDSHTPNAGGMGVLGIGVGGSDAVDAMAGMPWELVCPKVLGVRLTGRLSGWASSKDIICKLAGILTVSGGKGKVIEFFGPGAETLGATAMATICNMSAEVGSTSCIFPYSQAMARYLTATKRGDIARYADGFTETLLTADCGSEEYYDEVIEIDLSALEPHINGPFTPDLSHPLSHFKTQVQESSWPSQISHSMVGSCTNSSYEDLEKVYDLVQQAKKAGIDRPRTPFMVSPGSEQIRATAEDSGILPSLREAGAVVLSNSCGPCVGQWDRKDVDVAGAENNSVISSFNRNFTGRHDSNPATHSFVTSPEIATAFAYAGDLSFNPIHDVIPIDESGTSHFRFTPPVSNELPESFVAGSDLFQPPVLEDTSDYKVAIDEGSDRLELLTPFEPWKPGQAENMEVLTKVSGNCTTDHISPAGPWYNYRGHLSNISHNMLLGATNGFLPDASSLTMTGKTRDPTDGTIKFIHKAARTMKNAGIRWCIIGDNNYGEGSSREHAALEPRFLGGVAVIAKSFARIHETNLKKQGMFPLTFADPLDYDKIQEGDVISLLDVDGDALQPEKQITMKVVNKDETVWTAQLNHSYHAHQLAWLRAGSALNHVKKTILGSLA